MSAITFDTLKFSRKLTAAGATPELADALAEAQKESLSEIMETQLATKQDIFDIKAQLLVLKWMTGTLMAGVLALILKAFF